MNRFAVGLEIEEFADDGHHTLRLSGELEITSANTLQRAVVRLCEQPLLSLTIDLRELTFIDSTGLAAIILASKICERHPGGYDFWLIPGPSNIQRLFEVTGLIDALPFRGDPASAR